MESVAKDLPKQSELPLEVDQVEIWRLQAELVALLHQIVSVDPDAVMRIEQAWQRVKIERIVEKHLH